LEVALMNLRLRRLGLASFVVVAACTPFGPLSGDAAMDASLADAQRESTPEAATASDTAEALPVEPTPDAADDATLDAPRLARGSTCSASDQCSDGFCVDGVCCESACVCGSCAGLAPGTCVPAAAGKDPRNACGAYTCDGKGACQTMCNAGFGTCSTSCKAGESCDGAGTSVAGSTGVDLFCIVGGCLCEPGLTCQALDGGGAGKCE
jgi:hypothetical protein